MRLRIGSGFGIPVYLHWTFFLLPVWICVVYEPNPLLTLPMTLIVFGFLFLSVLLHEFGHILMARYFGIGTHDVTLYPIGGVARLLRMSEKPHEEILIALAGPAVNVVIGGLLFAGLVIAAVLDFDVLPPTGSAPIRIALAVAVLNAGLVIFNLLPAFPMDGGRVLRALLAFWLDFYQATLIAVRVGACVALLMGIFGVLSGSYMMPIVAVFVIFVGQQELMGVRMRERQKARALEDEPLEVLPVRPAWPNGTAQMCRKHPC